MAIDNNNADQLEVQQKTRYPRSIAFIIGNEFCERFSYYGAKAILVLYFRYVLTYTEDAATEYYHIFAMACYFTPVLGAIIADSLLGKFRTIFYISILYAIGNVILAYASYAVSRPVTWVGLAAIALGTGGIKPCVAAFGGDQFGPGQEKQLQTFFSFFYISINAGSLLSTFLTPILREDVHCFDRADCFPLAFGVPAALMLVALALFLIGKVVTDYVMVPPKKENVVVQVINCVFVSLSRKLFKKLPKRDHWLDYADDKYDAQTITDIKAVMRVLFLYLPLPIFWALFDQQGSRWTLQATKMDGDMFGVYRLKPDQIQVVNPLLIILMIPVFQYGVYPLFAKMNLLKKPLQRIVIGGVLAALSFIICAFFQLSIESELPPNLNANSVHLSIINGLSSDVQLNNEFLFNQNEETIEKYGILVKDNVDFNQLSKNLNLRITVSKKLENCEEKQYKVKINPNIKDAAILFITESICQDQGIKQFNFSDILVKPSDGGANTGLVFNINNFNYSDVNEGQATFWFRNKQFDEKRESLNISVTDFGSNNFASVGYVPYKELDIHLGGEYNLTLVRKRSETLVSSSLDLKQGGSYILVVYSEDKDKLQYKFHNIVKPNSVSMFWQVLQYAVITAGEIMFSITGLEFSYTQAPSTMKSVLQAAWLMTVAFGNLIVVIIATAKIFDKQSYEFFFFGGLMIADMFVFATMAFFYVPYEPSQPSLTDNDSNEQKKVHLNGSANKEESNGKNGIANDGFNEEDTKF